MAEYSKAFVLGGWSEDLDFIEPLAREADSGPHRIVEEAHPVTLAWALDNADKLNRESTRRIVLGHSAAKMAIRRAGILFVMNGAEPTPFYKTIARGFKVAFNGRIGREEHVPKPGVLNGIAEVAKHPSTLAVPWRVRTFSSVDSVIEDGEDAYPDGRVYLPTHLDEFKFGHKGEIAKARDNGIYAEMLQGYHNHPMLHPRAYMAEVERILNTIS